MISLSFNTKGTKMYCKLNDNPLPQIHLGNDKRHSIMMLKAIFDRREYIQSGKYSADVLEKLTKKIDDNFN